MSTCACLSKKHASKSADYSFTRAPTAESTRTMRRNRYKTQFLLQPFHQLRRKKGNLIKSFQICLFKFHSHSCQLILVHSVNFETDGTNQQMSTDTKPRGDIMSPGNNAIIGPVVVTERVGGGGLFDMLAEYF